jgi:hypothetical protein
MPHNQRRSLYRASQLLAERRGFRGEAAKRAAAEGAAERRLAASCPQRISQIVIVTLLQFGGGLLSLIEPVTDERVIPEMVPEPLRARVCSPSRNQALAASGALPSIPEGSSQSVAIEA